MNNSTQERTLALAGGRTLAYVTSGNASSTTVLLYLHGAFTVGEAERVSRSITAKNVHYVCPTLPGWGNTSPPPPSTSYVDCLTGDMTALLDHLYPSPDGRDRVAIRLYVSGGSFGTVPAQILYGTPYDKFPYGRYIVGVLLMGSLTPFRYHKDYAKHMTWSNYIMVGPISRWLPIVWLVTLVMAKKVSTVENAERFLRESLFDKMDAAGRADYAQWREREGIAEGETERRFAGNVVRSVAKSWEGFKLMSCILHSDWGFRPDALDEEHSRPFVMLVTSSGDKETPQAWTEYLAASYKNTKVKTVCGGHFAVLYYLNEVWAEFLEEVE